ncbi:uncharacterized protein LOC130134743 [Syzygium oleosum]|uniref:uncharacterized protein LOC130134743 n=1 Tax=Syzygium oleosum TaxID=219896 RepID=UPI0024B9AAE8|nr:uncharacterized protein LOC130134743 [Syzygium oleosum]
MALPLGCRLQRALRKLGEAEAEYAEAEHRVERAMKEKPNAPRAAAAADTDEQDRDAAKQKRDAARAWMDAAVEELRGTECLVLYSMEQVRAFLEIRGRLGGCGRLRRVRIDCCDDRAAVQMGHLLLDSGGFDWIFELPPVTRAD